MRKKTILGIMAGCLLLICNASLVLAEVRLPAIVGDNMVLQQGRPVPIWGWADAGEDVTVAVAGQSLAAKADANGRWQVTVAELESTEPLQMTITGSSGCELTLKNLLVGEVWVCSGQSNMQWSVNRSDNAQEEIAAADYPKIRLFTVTRKTADTPQPDCKGQWAECSPQTVPGFSAAAYFFGRHLHKQMDVPVGLINTSWGGTPSEAWTCRKALEAQSSLKPLLERWDASVAGFDSVLADYRKRLASWEEAAAKAQEADKEPPKKPRQPGNPADSPHRPASLFNGMIAPLVPFAIRGAIWYQGESNVSRAHQYRTIFPAMIRNWRAVWGEGQFPFGFVQIAPYRYGGRDPAECAELWEAQLLALKGVPHTGMAVTMDIGDVKDIHPTNKQDVGLRLGLWAMAKVYGCDLVYSGPIYDSMSIEGDRTRIRFAYAASGLNTSDGQPPSHFTVAGADRKFHPASAVIDGSTVVVRCDKVPQPVAVRYAWTDTAEPNLTNKEGLPAAPFRTDGFPCITEGRH